MRMLIDMLKLYASVLGAGFVVMGAGLFIQGILFGFLEPDLAIGGMVLAGLGIALGAIGIVILWALHHEPAVDIYKPPPGARRAEEAHTYPWGTPVVERFELPPVPIILAIFLCSVGFGMATLLINNWTACFALMIPYFFASTFPPLMWMAWVYNQEKKEPEPPRWVLYAFTGGMLSVIPALFINTTAQLAGLVYWSGLDEDTMVLYTLAVVAVVVAPLCEEAFKPMVLYVMRKEIFTESDGLMYGVMAGMGFALLENMQYLSLGFALPLLEGIETVDGSLMWGGMALARGLGSVGLHGVGAGFIGRAMARKFLGRTDWSGVLGAYAVAVLIHAGWNGGNVAFEFVHWPPMVEAAAVITFLVVYTICMLYFLYWNIQRARQEDDRLVRPGVKTEVRSARYHEKRAPVVLQAWSAYNAYQAWYQQYAGYYAQYYGGGPPPAPGGYGGAPPPGQGRVGPPEDEGGTYGGPRRRDGERGGPPKSPLPPGPPGPGYPPYPQQGYAPPVANYYAPYAQHPGYGYPPPGGYPGPDAPPPGGGGPGGVPPPPPGTATRGRGPGGPGGPGRGPDRGPGRGPDRGPPSWDRRDYDSPRRRRTIRKDYPPPPGSGSGASEEEDWGDAWD